MSGSIRSTGSGTGQRPDAPQGPSSPLQGALPTSPAASINELLPDSLAGSIRERESRSPAGSPHGAPGPVPSIRSSHSKQEVIPPEGPRSSVRFNTGRDSLAGSLQEGNPGPTGGSRSGHPKESTSRTSSIRALFSGSSNPAKEPKIESKTSRTADMLRRLSIGSKKQSVAPAAPPANAAKPSSSRTRELPDVSPTIAKMAFAIAQSMGGPEMPKRLEKDLKDQKAAKKRG